MHITPFLVLNGFNPRISVIESIIYRVLYVLQSIVPFNPRQSNTVLKRKILLPLLMSSVTFHFLNFVVQATFFEMAAMPFPCNGTMLCCVN